MWDQTRVAWKINRKKLGVSKGEKLIAIKAIIANQWIIISNQSDLNNLWQSEVNCFCPISALLYEQNMLLFELYKREPSIL